jgi:hypothetical protein
MLRVELAPSWGLGAALVGMHAVAGVCLAAVVPGTLAPAALGLLLSALGFAAAWDRALLRHRKSVTELAVLGPDLLWLRTRDREEFEVRAGRRKHVSRLAVIIPVRGSMRRTIVVPRDMLDVESFRKLRLWALWGLPGVAPTQLPV